MSEFFFREIFIDPTTNDTWKYGQFIKRPVLAKTLEVISKEGANALYNGSLTDKFIKELKDLGSILTKEDLTTFKYIKLRIIKNYFDIKI